MKRKVLLKKMVADARLANYGAYRLRVEIEDLFGDWPDDCLFIYQRRPANAYSGANVDTFEAVAGPSQLSDYPANDPDPDQGWPKYRLNYVQLDLISSAQAEEVYQRIKESVEILAEALDRLDTFSQIEETWVPYPPTEDELSSSSSA